MSESGAFCPRCGDAFENSSSGGMREGDESRVLCDSCYLSDFDLVSSPETLTLTVCTQCGSIQRDDVWIDPSDDDITALAIEEVQESVGIHVDADDVAWAVQPEQIDENHLRIIATFTGWVRNQRVEEEIEVPVTITRGTCSRCGKIAGDYYAGIIQVRATDRELQPEEKQRAKSITNSVVADMRESGDREVFVSEITDVPGGIDIKISTTKIGERVARQVTAEFGGEYTTSETLVTEDSDGNEVYRVNYAVRLPRFVAGDIIDPADENGPVVVESTRTNLKGTRLTTGEPFDVPGATDTTGMKRVGSMDEKQSTTLVAVEDEYAIQVLDPDTYQSVSIPNPSFVDETSETIAVVKISQGVFAVPND